MEKLKPNIYQKDVFKINYDELLKRNIKKISNDTFDYLARYKSWERTGFTEKSLEWSALKDLKHIEKISIKEVFEKY